MVNNILKNNIEKDIILLPFECNNEDLFFKENFVFFQKYVIL